MSKTGLRFFSPFTLRSLTNYYMPIGQKVVVIGGQIQGIEVAEFFVHRHKDVTIVDEEVIKDIQAAPAGSLGGLPLAGVLLLVARVVLLLVARVVPVALPEDLGKDMPGTTRDRLINYLHAHGVKTIGVKIDRDHR